MEAKGKLRRRRSGSRWKRWLFTAIWYGMWMLLGALLMLIVVVVHSL